MVNLYVALIHSPVVDKNGEIITSAVTNMDLHDIARASKTYAIKGFYVVTPLLDQKALVEKIVNHWTNGYGARYNGKRKEAIELVRLENTIEDVIEEVRREEKKKPVLVATSAKFETSNLEYETFREKLATGDPYILAFGTAWGLAESLTASADYRLMPVKGPGAYNHLSVRSAVSIILDRIAGSR